MPISLTSKEIASGLALFAVGAIAGHLAVSALVAPDQPKATGPADPDRLSAILSTDITQTSASSAQLREFDRQAMVPDDDHLDQILAGLDIPDVDLAKLLNSLSRPLQHRAWALLIRQRLTSQSIGEVYALAQLSLNLGIDFESRPDVLVIDAAVASDPRAAIEMVKTDGGSMELLLDRYAKIDASAALAAATVELAGTPAKLRSLEFFIFSLMKNYPDQFSPRQLADALPERRFRIGNINDLAETAAIADFDATLEWVDSIENSILRNGALGRITGFSGDRVWEMLPRLASQRDRDSAVYFWARNQAREGGTAALSTALQVEDPLHRHAALTGVISWLARGQPAELVVEIVRRTADGEIPEQIWDLLDHEIKPTTIFDENPSKRPQWLADLDPETREALETHARRSLGTEN